MSLNNELISRSTVLDLSNKKKRRNYSKSHEFLVGRFKNLDVQDPSSRDKSDFSSDASTLNSSSTDRSASNFSDTTLKPTSYLNVPNIISEENKMKNKPINNKNIEKQNSLNSKNLHKLNSNGKDVKKNSKTIVNPEKNDKKKPRNNNSNNNNNNNNENTRSRPSCCVFVASLSLEMSDQVLLNTVKNHFAKYGEIKLTKVLRDSSNRPYAFVQYFNTEDAHRALIESAGTLLNKRPVRVEMAKVNRTLFVKEIDIFNKELSDLSLFNNFTQIGELEQVLRLNDYAKLIKKSSVIEPTEPQRQLILENINSFDDNDLNTVSGKWLVQFAFREDAISAHAFCQNDSRYDVEWTSNVDLNGNDEFNLVSKFCKLTKEVIDELLKGDTTFKLHFADSQIENDLKNNQLQLKHDMSDYSIIKKNNLAIDVNSIFVGQLTLQCTKKDLLERFSKHGVIESIKLFNRNPNNCYAFITFKDKKATASAVEVENHSSMHNKSIHVQYRETNHINAEKKKFFNNNVLPSSFQQQQQLYHPSENNIRSENLNLGHYQESPNRNSSTSLREYPSSIIDYPAKNTQPYQAYGHTYPQSLPTQPSSIYPYMADKKEYFYVPVENLSINPYERSINNNNNNSNNNQFNSFSQTPFFNASNSTMTTPYFQQAVYINPNSRVNDFNYPPYQQTEYYNNTGINQMYMPSINQYQSYEHLNTYSNDKMTTEFNPLQYQKTFYNKDENFNSATNNNNVFFQQRKKSIHGKKSENRLSFSSIPTFHQFNEHNSDIK